MLIEGLLVAMWGYKLDGKWILLFTVTDKVQLLKLGHSMQNQTAVASVYKRRVEGSSISKYI